MMIGCVLLSGLNFIAAHPDAAGLYGDLGIGPNLHLELFGGQTDTGSPNANLFDHIVIQVFDFLTPIFFSR